MTSTPVPSLQLCMRAYLPCPGASLRLIWMIPTGDSSAAAVSAVATDCPTAAVLDHLLFPHRCAMIDQQMFLGLVQTSAVRWFLLVSPMVRSCVAGIMVVPLQPAVYICVAALRSCCFGRPFGYKASAHLHCGSSIATPPPNLSPIPPLRESLDSLCYIKPSNKLCFLSTFHHLFVCKEGLRHLATYSLAPPDLRV